MTDLDRLAALLAATAEGDSLGPVYRVQAARLLAAGVRLPEWAAATPTTWADVGSAVPPISKAQLREARYACSCGANNMTKAESKRHELEHWDPRRRGL